MNQQQSPRRCLLVAAPDRLINRSIGACVLAACLSLFRSLARSPHAGACDRRQRKGERVGTQGLARKCLGKPRSSRFMWPLLPVDCLAWLAGWLIQHLDLIAAPTYHINDSRSTKRFLLFFVHHHAQPRRLLRHYDRWPPCGPRGDDGNGYRSQWALAVARFFNGLTQPVTPRHHPHTPTAPRGRGAQDGRGTFAF